MNWKEILRDPKIKNIISTAVKAWEQAQPKLGLNIFTLTSDYYYRENYHSDIIKEFLDPNGSHYEGNVYLNLFIEMMKNHGIVIGESRYTNSKVTRETHKIDILIKGLTPDDEGKYHYIIIENKINDAVDTYRQIPGYVKKIEAEGGEVDAVIYIPKNPYKHPDQRDWSEDEIIKINPIMRQIPAHQVGKINLVDSWIVPCINESHHLDSISVLRQYASLIKFLTPKIMSDNNINEFINYININHKGLAVEDVISLRQMIDKIPEQMATDLRETLIGYSQQIDPL